ncbi:MAG: hypothetical protein ACPGWR_21930 [Ardenticatenaceae bacterium]
MLNIANSVIVCSLVRRLVGWWVGAWCLVGWVGGLVGWWAGFKGQLVGWYYCTRRHACVAHTLTPVATLASRTP